MDKSEISIRGTVAQKPELNRTSTGKVFTRINVAADEVSVDGQKIDAKENKWHSVVFWSADAVDMSTNVKQGPQVAVNGQQVIRQAESRVNGEMKTFSEIHRAQLTIEKEPKPRAKGVDVEMKGEVLYDPELKASANGKYYTTVTIRAGGRRLSDPRYHPLPG